MLVQILKRTICNGKIYQPGETVELKKALAESLIKRKIAVASDGKGTEPKPKSLKKPSKNTSLKPQLNQIDSGDGGVSISEGAFLGAD